MPSISEVLRLFYLISATLDICSAFLRSMYLYSAIHNADRFKVASEHANGKSAEEKLSKMFT